MGGIHVTHRATNNSNYTGVQAKLTLPTSISSDQVNGIKPEFIFGFYKGNYGVDIGVVYQDSTFKLFYWTLADTTPNYHSKEELDLDPTLTSDQGGESGSIGTTVGEQITLKAYLNGNKITCEAIKSNGNKTTLHCPLSSDALNAFQTGARINRELVIAANPTGIVNPCNIYFYDAYFSEGILTTTSTTQQAVTDSNTVIQRYLNDGNVNTSTLRTLNCEWGTDANGYAYERAACDMNRK